MVHSEDQDRSIHEPILDGERKPRRRDTALDHLSTLVDASGRACVRSAGDSLDRGLDGDQEAISQTCDLLVVPTFSVEHFE